MGSESGGRRRGGAGRARAQSPRAGARPRASASDAAPSAPDVVWRGGNRVLASLPPSELALLRPELTECHFESGTVLYEQGAEIDFVYFPDSAVVSLVNPMDSGAVIEVGTIGNESAAGLTLSLGVSVSVPKTLVQVPGRAQRMSASAFRKAIDDLPHLRAMIARCVHAFLTQVSLTAACNRLHGIEQRCARWLLLTHDRVDGADTFPLTHQFLSFMLGVRRAGVTEALGDLAKQGLITSTRARITILNRPGLEGAACECYHLGRRFAGAPFVNQAGGIA